MPNMERTIQNLLLRVVFSLLTNSAMSYCLQGPQVRGFTVSKDCCCNKKCFDVNPSEGNETNTADGLNETQQFHLPNDSVTA